MSTDLATTDFTQEVAPEQQWANALTITTQDDFVAASDRLKGIKALSKKIADWFSPMKRKAQESHKEICSTEKAQLAPLEAAEMIAKRKMLAWTKAEEEKRLAEQRRIQAALDEKARLERQKLEQERERQLKAQRESQAKADAARQAAEAEQASATERKRLLAQAEAAERKAAAAALKAEVKADEAAAVIAPVVQVAPAAKVSGLSTRATWKAEIKDVDVFMRWCVANNRLEMLLPNMKSLEQYARSMGARAKADGVVFFEQSSLAMKAS